MLSAITNLGGAFLSGAGQLWSDRKNRKSAEAENDRQYDLARNTIQYKTEDAKKAGIHPLYALGGQTMSSAVSLPQQQNPMKELGQAITNMPSKTTHQDQMENILFQDAQAKLRNTNLQNDLLQQEYNKNKIALAQDITQKASNDKDALKVLGKKVSKDKGFSDTQAMEDRYGDPLSWIYGLGVLGADVKQSYDDWSKSRVPYKAKTKRKAHRYR